MSLCVFDLDGTLCNIEHRLGYVRTKPKNWKAFEAGIINDTVNEPVAEVYRALVRANSTIVLASGRSEDSKETSETWLRKNDLWGWDKLYMRKSGDYRADDIVKREILDEIISDYGKKPDLWIDDRPRVVKAIRDCGVFVMDVYQGVEDF